MGLKDQIEDGFNDFLQELIDMDHLDGVALSVTKQVINKGMDSLLKKQNIVFKRHVLDEYTIPECDMCGSNIPWSEMYEAATEHGMCNYCWHMTQKDE